MVPNILCSSIESSIDEFHNKFNEIKKSGWVRSNRQHDTGIGKTFEDLMGIQENNSPLADFKEWELKTKRSSSNSLLTLFTMSPKPKKINSKIRSEYGYYDEKFPEIKCFRGTLNSKNNSKIKGTRGRILVNVEKNKINLSINEKNIAFWEFADLEKKLNDKLKNLIYIKAESKTKNNDEYFKFISYDLFLYKGFDVFVELLVNGAIEIDIRLGVYSSGKNAGKPHDHGTGFRIAPKDYNSLFEKFSFE